MRSYINGETIRVYAVFANGRTPTGQSHTFGDGNIISNITGTISDPAAITLKVRGGGQSETDYTYGVSVIQKDATGCYYADLIVNINGRWDYRWVGTGISAGIGDGSFFVNEGNF